MLRFFTRPDFKGIVVNGATAETQSALGVQSADHLVKRTPDKYARERLKDPLTGKSYVESLTTSSGVLFAEETPGKENGDDVSEVKFSDVPNMTQLKKEGLLDIQRLEKESFDFVVTKASLRATGTKRERSQLSCVGESAKNSFRRQGARLLGGDRLHHCHRHGFALGGAQSAANLDPGTDGSNYRTWLYIETHIREIITVGGYDEVRVKGQVFYHPVVKLPWRIDYQLSYGNGRLVEASTFPLQRQKPTVSEYEAVKRMIPLVRTPVKADTEDEAEPSPSNVSTQLRF